MTYNDNNNNNNNNNNNDNNDNNNNNNNNNDNKTTKMYILSPPPYRFTRLPLHSLNNFHNKITQFLKILRSFF